MISSARNLKHKIQQLNVLGQKQIIQPVPDVLDCLGHFVPKFCQNNKYFEDTKISFQHC